MGQQHDRAASTTLKALLITLGLFACVLIFSICRSGVPTQAPRSPAGTEVLIFPPIWLPTLIGEPAWQALLAALSRSVTLQGIDADDVRYPSAASCAGVVTGHRPL